MYKVSSSATSVTWGLVLLVLGGAALQVGQSAQLGAALSMYSSGNEGSGWMLAGVILGLVGLITLVSGVHQLAVNVDVAAQAAAAALQKDRLAALEAPDEEPTMRDAPHGDVLPPLNTPDAL